MKLAWSRADTFVVMLVTALTAVAFLPSLRCGFILDDDVVIAHQPHVNTGVTAGNIRWSLTASELGYPIPVTLWSFMLDTELFGVQPRAFHAENIVWHLANVALLYLLLRRLTNCRWRSALVALLFAVHPLRVESVTWVTERKDMLAAFFGLTAIHVYVCYARRGGKRWYLPILPLFALSLFAKPMLLLLPVLLLGLDYWPLRRIGWKISFRKAVEEKTPLVCVAVVAALLGIIAPAPRRLPTGHLPFGALAANAVVSYVRYVGKMIWFRKLAISYPVVPHWPAWQVAGAAAMLLVVTIIAAQQASHRPWLTVGWLWYTAILLPAAGLHVLGDFSMADRYTYFPMIGLLIMLVWSLPDRIAEGRMRLPTAAALAALVAGLIVATRTQAMIWRDNITLFRHAIQTGGPSMSACGNLALGLLRDHRAKEAIPFYKRALEFDNDNMDLLEGLAAASDEVGDTQAAVSVYQEVADRNSGDAMLLYNLGTDLVALGRPGEAIPYLRRAVTLDPSSIPLRGNLATALLRTGDFKDAIEQCHKALETDPSAAGVRETLASALAHSGQLDAAKAQYQLLILNNPASSSAYTDLGNLSLDRRQVEFAISCFRHAIEINPRLSAAHNGLGMALAQQGKRKEASSEFHKALEIDPGNAEAMRGLGWSPATR